MLINGYVFLCANSTEKECFQRLLLGGKREYKKKVPQVKIGDNLFLYNYQESLLYGPFKATSEAREDIEPDAWNGKFPWQVKVELIKKYKPLSRADLIDVLVFKKFPPAVLTGEQVKQLSQLFQANKRLPFFENIIPHTTTDGHRVRSSGEMLIDNWLYKHGILHAYEKQLENIDGVPETMYCDFFIPNSKTYIEFWGLTDKKYLKRKNEKLAFYRANNMNLIEVFQKDLNELDEILKSLLQ